MVWYPAAAAAAGAYGVVAGLLVPLLIARIPEPAPDPGDADAADEAGQAPAGDTAPPAEKEHYADIARLPHLRVGAAVGTGAVAALLGAAVGWRPELSIFMYLAPVGVALAVVDWRTRLLPTKVIAPSYAVVLALAVLSSWADGDWHHLETAGWGWVVAGGTFLVLWLVYPRGMGYGDVRLSGVLGLALGYLGWAPMLTGVYAGFVLGGVGGLLLSVARIVDRKAYPFGPFMLLGALVGVLVGPYVAAWYG